MLLASPPASAPFASATSLPDPTEEVGVAALAAKEYLARVRIEMRARHDAGAGGLELVAAYTDAVDRLVRFLFANATLHFASKFPRLDQQCTVIAQGGYGRGELNPASDIDLLFLYPWKVNPYVETVAEVILYALWDAGLAVGHALRNIRECGRLAARDMKVKTAILDARFLCGDETLYGEFDRIMREEVWSENATQFFKEKLAESIERHARAGDSVFLLQPQLKEGQGGLRDLHTALWMAKVKFKVRTFHDLVRLGVMSEAAVLELDRAVDFLWRVRNAMHLAANAHQDLLSFELQERLAPELGFGPGRAGVEGFMRAYYGHAATVNRFGDAVVARSVQPTEPYRGRQPAARVVREGMRIQGRTLTVAGAEVFARRPAAIVQVFAEAQRHGVTLASTTRELIRDALPLLDAHRDEPAVAAAFLTILRARGHVYETLFEMHKLGVLTALIPEFGRLDCLIAHDPFHIYTVDQHSLMGVREIERLRSGEFTRALPHLTQVMNEIRRPELLFLGMIFHDVGKGHGDDHSGRGARMMRDIARRLGLNQDESAACEFLVQHHLLMSHLAQRRDVHDDQLIADFCRLVRTVDDLDRLYVLTYADMRAVAPGVWTTWRDSLLAELYVRAREFLEKGVFEAEDRGALAARVRGRVVEATPAAERAEMERFLASMPDGYVTSTPEEMLSGHGELQRRLLAAEAGGERPAVATLLSQFPERDLSEFAICTRDRPGLFAMLSGVLAAHGLNILAARIATSDDGLALDAFRVSGEESESGGDPERWERVERTLRRVLAGEVDVEELVRRSRRPSILARRRRAVATEVEIDNQVSREYTVLDVYTRDRVGLLFTITNCLYHLWVEIHLAKITTMVEQVLDVFYVTDNEGRKIEDPARLEQIRRELTRALEAEEAPEAVQAAGA
ncbi:MAG TPA: [protein-PII] uridylyltransferase [Candidatus Binatia bacterium]|nr:[protein-PII] uridylyltransferase [Candidatus Binatia bacterium]